MSSRPHTDDGAIASRVLQVAWCIVGVVAAAGFALTGLIMLVNAGPYDDDRTAGSLVILASPFVALAPLTIAHALRRGDQIVRRLASLDVQNRP